MPAKRAHFGYAGARAGQKSSLEATILRQETQEVVGVAAEFPLCLDHDLGIGLSSRKAQRTSTTASAGPFVATVVERVKSRGII